MRSIRQALSIPALLNHLRIRHWLGPLSGILAWPWNTGILKILEFNTGNTGTIEVNTSLPAVQELSCPRLVTFRELVHNVRRGLSLAFKLEIAPRAVDRNPDDGSRRIRPPYRWWWWGCWCWQGWQSQDGMYGVYAEVAKLRSWINTKIEENGGATFCN